MQLTTAKIITNRDIAPDIFSMTIYAPEVAATAKAGQFAMIYLDSGELLLPRPISICDAGAHHLTFVYQVVGKGTGAMAKMPAGGAVKLLAPLGKGFFTLPKSALHETRAQAHFNPCESTARSPLKNVALIGGGIGAPPLLLLAKTLKNQGANVDVYLGFRTNPILIDEFESVADHLYIATEDGSVGHKGNILEVLHKNASITPHSLVGAATCRPHQQQNDKPYDEFLSCGPRPMLDALARYAHSQNTPCQLSMEERMACGLGTCVGCVLEVAGAYQKICTEGPVFYSDSIDCNH
ncbi:MAG: dihydroorotate dehydrogenase electron transfer subunit [Defluviitaleaceae bacterium]|nr:dihydroorotate dehydrogenase electron transfer subunit [Defluviitaleaceae bacterium]